MNRLWVVVLVAALGITGCEVVTPAPRPVYVAQPAPPPPTVVVAAAPPPPRVEVIPVAPGPTYVWAPGHWQWNRSTFYWVSGRYVARPYQKARWTPDHWVRSGNGWVYVPGRWS